MERITNQIALVPVIPLGLSLGAFFVISYVLCVVLYLLFPQAVLDHAMLSLFLPGFKLLTWGSLYVALIFGPLYNYCASRWA
jgi:hypothetical protein